MLCLNHKVMGEDGKGSYVSFIVMPDVPDDDHAGPEGDGGAYAGAANSAGERADLRPEEYDAAGPVFPDPHTD